MGWTINTASEADRAFIQARLLTFAKAIVTLSSLGLSIQLVTSFFSQIEGFVPVLGASALNLALGVGLLLFMRGRGRSIPVLRATEVAFMLTSSLLTVSMVRLVMVVLLNAEALGGPSADGQRFALAFSEMLGLSFAFCLRAALVPSDPRYAALLTASAAPFLIMGLAFLWPALPGEEVVRAIETGSERPAIIGNIAIWWSLFTIMCTIIASVVHGLRKQVRAARQLGQYVLEAKIGEGGMGTVYRAKHAMMKRPTAVKLLPPERTSDEQVARFEREVQQTARLSHPNTIRIYDYGRTPDGVFYYAMELLDGATLDRIVDLGGPMPASRVVHVVSAIAASLVEAHDEGLIHRDIKPSNISLCRQGGISDVPKLLDFGLVKDVEASTGGQVGLTGENQLTGTPLYMAPEAIRSADLADARSDLYALGAVAYYLLTGEHVFVRDTVVEVLAAHLHEEPEPPSARLEQSVHIGLEATILACLEKDPNQRPKSASELLTRLEALDTAQWTTKDAKRWWRDWGLELTQEPSEISVDRGPLTINADR